jgi:hypothetical protein
MFSVETHSFLPDQQCDGGNLARQCKTRHRRLHSACQTSFVEILERSRCRRASRKSTALSVRAKCRLPRRLPSLPPSWRGGRRGRCGRGRPVGLLGLREANAVRRHTNGWLAFQNGGAGTREVDRYEPESHLRRPRSEPGQAQSLFAPLDRFSLSLPLGIVGRVAASTSRRSLPVASATSRTRAGRIWRL